LFRLGSAFNALNPFLQFLLIDFLEKFATFGEKKVVKIVNGLSVFMNFPTCPCGNGLVC